MYKSVLLGCGKRSDAHADAYASIGRAKLVAACCRHDDRLQAFCARFSLAGHYRDLETMLEREKPDLLHIVTGPRGRHDAMKIASDMRVPAVLIEKPIALEGEDYRQIAELATTSQTRFAVNTQLHYHPANAWLRELVRGGGIGDLRLIEVTARSTLVNQGPHVLQLVSGYAGDVRPRRVFAQAGGARFLDDPREPSPDDVAATIEFDGGMRVLVTVGERVGRITSDRDSRFLHKQIAVYGSRGFTRWAMYDWESLTSEGHCRGEHDYVEENRPAQVALTDAVIDWLDDPHQAPPIRLKQAVREFNVVLGIYASALLRQPIDLPVDPPDRLLERLRQALAQRASDGTTISRECMRNHP